jgi:hypothetical protein
VLKTKNYFAIDTLNYRIRNTRCERCLQNIEKYEQGMQVFSLQATPSNKRESCDYLFRLKHLPSVFDRVQ